MSRRIVFAVSVAVLLLAGCPGPDSDSGYTLSGTVTRAWGGALAGVTVTLAGTASRSTVTDADGRYAFGGVADGSYTVTPALAGWVFAPAGPPVVVSGAGRTQDFTADGAYTISGSVTGAGEGDVSISLSGGAVVKPPALTSATGAYAFTGIPNGTYTLTPAPRAGWVFAPVAATVVVNGASATQEFGMLALRSIAGRVVDGLGNGLSGMTVRLSGRAAAIATTDATGRYAFEGLVPGLASYVVAHATFGHSSSPEVRTYTLTGDVTDADFTATRIVGTSTFRGTLAYAGSKAGPVYVTVRGASGGGDSAGGTGLPRQQGPWSGRAFTVRNVQIGGTVTVRAWVDTLGTGRFNAGADPSATFTGAASDASGAPIDVGALTLVDPSPTPSVASPLSVNATLPFDGGAVVAFDAPRDANGDPLADSYRVYWNDGPTVDADHALGSQLVPAGPDFTLVGGLANGTGYWFRVVAYLGGAPLAGQSAATSSATTPAPPSGAATVSGTVTHPAVGAAALYVIAQRGSGPAGAHVLRIPAPAGTQTGYSLDVPPGSYQLFAFMDVDGDGAITAGEPAGFPGDSSQPLVALVAGPNAGPTLALPAGDGTATLRTSRWRIQQSAWTNLVAGVASGAKVPIAATLSGPGLRGPVDLGLRLDGGSAIGLGAYRQTDPVLPAVGDAYTLAVTYADGTTESFQRVVTGLFGGTPGALEPADGDAFASHTPRFRWTAPPGAPGPFGYGLQVGPEGGGDGVWETFLPSTASQVNYNADGTARLPRLPALAPHEWIIRAIDGNGNDASTQARFTTEATLLVPHDSFATSTLFGTLWQTPQFFRVLSSGKALLGVRADDMQARTEQGQTYTNVMNVAAGARRVTTLRASVSVPAASATRSGTAVLLGGIRLLYQPLASRGRPFPSGNLNVLGVSLELYDDGSGPRIRRRVLHCDDPACVAVGNAGTTAVDPDGFTASGVDARAAGAYDTTYALSLSVNEATGVFTWSVQGGAFATPVAGTADVSAWAAGVGTTLSGAFLAAQLLSRVSDEVGGSSAAVTPEFDDVEAGFDGGAAALWDDFSAPQFRVDRWGPVDSDVVVSAGRLHLSSWLTTAATGGGGIATAAQLAYPASFSAWQATVTIEGDAPAADPGSGNAVAMTAAFYNDGRGGPGDATGDVRLQLQLRTDSLSYSLHRCENATCTSATVLPSVALAPSPLSPLGVGTAHALRMEWNPFTERLGVGIDGVPPVLVDPTALAPVGSPTPHYPLHQFTATVSIGPGAAAGTTASTLATIDDVLVAPP